MTRRGAAQVKAPAKPRRAKRPKCPICGKPVSPEYRPFCSKHCADIDLSRWLDGRYVVPGERLSKEPDGDED